MGNNWLATYVQLTPGTTAESINQAIEKFKKQHAPDTKAVFYLQPLRNIHLYWVWGGGPIKNVRLFSIIAVLLIIVAAINFTNLSTAMAAKRYKEIGIKKTFGADRKVLVVQFLSETLLLSVISFFIALILAETFLPWYNKLLGTELHIHYSDGILIAGFLGIMLLTGFLSGVYPALFLSSFKPVKILKSNGSLHKRSLLRETLVVLQFCLAIMLIVNTIIIKKQQDFMRKKDVGIQRENIMYMSVRGELNSKYELFKSQLLADPDIMNVCRSSFLPTGIYSNGGGYKWQGKPPDVDPLVSNTTIDCDYLKTFGIKMYEGEFYPENTYNDTLHVVINKTFADIIGLKSVIGSTLEMWSRKLTILGVTEDFNFKPLSQKVEPLVMVCSPNYSQYIMCRISSGDIQKTVKRIEKLHEGIDGNYPFEYHFLDAEYDSLYANEARQGKIFNIFSFLAILISCLGLFGLSSFMMAQRIKEIGVRKSNGATVMNLMMLFSRYYTRWVLISFVIAVPVSYFIIQSWLKSYAYKTPISWWIFAVAGGIAFLIAMLTVGWQIWKSARRNPVEALRYE
jgi:putative ABC transport system permease protein